MKETHDFTPEQLRKLAARIGADIETWLRDHTVEPHYRVDEIARLLGGITERTIWNYVDEYETSAGKEGIGPYVKLSHKVVLIPASSINRFLKSRTIDAAELTKAAA